MKTDVAKFHGYTEEQLGRLPTRHLMAIRKAVYSRRGGCTCCPPGMNPAVEPDDIAFNAGQWELEENLKKVLSTREHIPSKREGQALRREAAKRGR